MDCKNKGWASCGLVARTWRGNGTYVCINDGKEPSYDMGSSWAASARPDFAKANKLAARHRRGVGNSAAQASVAADPPPPRTSARKRANPANGIGQLTGSGEQC